MTWRAMGDDPSPRAPRAPRWILLADARQQVSCWLDRLPNRHGRPCTGHLRGNCGAWMAG
jgi:hypothetical protein